jgi:hypothetical protein
MVSIIPENSFNAKDIRQKSFDYLEKVAPRLPVGFAIEAGSMGGEAGFASPALLSPQWGFQCHSGGQIDAAKSWRR